MIRRTAFNPVSAWDALCFRARYDDVRTAVIDWNGAAVDFAELHHRSVRRARALQAQLEVGSRVALVFDRHEWLDFAVTYLGALGAGAVPVVLENHHDRLVPRVHETGARVVVTGPGVAAREPGWLRCADLDDSCVVGVDRVRADVLAEPSAGSPLDVMYTSGTVGGVYLPVEYAVSDWLDGVVMRPVRRQVTCVHALFPPHSSAGAHGLLLGHLFRGVRSVASSTRDVHDLVGEARAFVAAVRRHRPTEVVLTPALIATLRAEGLVDTETFASVVTVKFGGAPLSSGAGADLIATLPHVRLLSMYGTTESARALLIAPWRPDRPDVIGLADEHVRIVDHDGGPAEPGEEGEIQVRAPGATLRTRYAGTAVPALDGWTPTGDIGRVEDGWVRLVGRSKEILVLASGAKTNASNIERRVLQSTAVAAVKVVGLPQATVAADVVAAAVVLAPGARPSDVAMAYAVLRPEEVPERTLILDELPRNAMSKVVVPEVRSQLAALPPGVHDHRTFAAGAGAGRAH